MLTDSESDEAGIYRTLLQEGFDGLSGVMKAAHSAPLQAHGTFDVAHGKGSAAKAIIRLLGLPRSGTGLPVRLVVTSCGRALRWQRTIGYRVLKTTQTARNSRLIERHGLGEIIFRVHVDHGDVVYEQEAMKFLSIPVPFAPIVSGRVSQAGASWQVEVSVTWRGKRVCCYGGVLQER